MILSSTKYAIVFTKPEKNMTNYFMVLHGAPFITKYFDNLTSCKFIKNLKSEKIFINLFLNLQIMFQILYKLNNNNYL
jgi:hypothetical protein